MDAVTAVSGSGPAYVFLLAEAMAQAGVAAGLPAALADRLARETVAGSGELLHRSADAAATLRQNVTSPGGTTAAALEVLMAADGVAPLMTKAIAAATQARQADSLARRTHWQRALEWPRCVTRVTCRSAAIERRRHVMARKAARSKAAPLTVTRQVHAAARPARRASASSTRFMALLAEHPIERIGLAEIAERAGVTLADLRGEFGSPLAMLAAHVKELDRKVLAAVDPDMDDESPRERLFDVLMRRLELLAPHREAVRSLLRSARRDPPLALALNAMAVRSQQWMLTAAGIDAAGPKGMMRAQGLALLFANVLRTWVDDDDDNTPARSPRSTASWRAASAWSACSTISAGFRRRPCRSRGPRMQRAPRARPTRRGRGESADREP